jgi:hypothetical protein
MKVSSLIFRVSGTWSRSPTWRAPLDNLHTLARDGRRLNDLSRLFAAPAMFLMRPSVSRRRGRRRLISLPSWNPSSAIALKRQTLCGRRAQSKGFIARQIESFNDLNIAELQELAKMERQLSETLLFMAA